MENTQKQEEPKTYEVVEEPAFKKVQIVEDDSEDSDDVEAPAAQNQEPSEERK